MFDWIKEHIRDIILFVLLFLVSTTSFAIGYLLAKEKGQVPIVFEKNSTQ